MRDMAEGTQVKPATMAEPATKLQHTRSGEATKLLYILVQDDPLPGAKEGEQGPTYRYTRGLLLSTLQLMGCKARHAVKVSGQNGFQLTMSSIFRVASILQFWRLNSKDRNCNCFSLL